MDSKRVLGARSLSTLHTWINMSYAVHADMQSHTGGMVSFGHGVLHTKSLKQKLHTKSSTEAKLVGISEYLPYNIWMTHFLEHQRIVLGNNVLLYQDNQSAICMEINGRNSCTNNSRHIDIGYFFKGRVTQGDLKIRYCPTEDMVADFFTKSPQGSMFIKLKNQIMGHSTLTPSIDAVDSHEMKECVEVEDNSTQA